jgi:hypothetical protein
MLADLDELFAVRRLHIAEGLSWLRPVTGKPLQLVSSWQPSN